MKVPDLPGTEDAPFDFSLAHTIADTAPNPCLCLHLVHPSLFVGHESGTICCYNVETFEAGPQLQGHTGAVTCFTGDLKRGYLASGSQDHTVRLWDPVTGALLDIFTDHKAPITALCLDSPAKGFPVLYSVAEDGEIRHWTLPYGKKGVTHALKAVSAFAVHGDTLLICPKTCKIQRYSVSSDKGLRGEYRGHSNVVTCIEMLALGQKMVTASADATLRVWDVQRQVCLETLEGHFAGVGCLALYGPLAFSGCAEGSIRVWNWQQGQCIHDFSELSGVVHGVCVQRGRLYACAEDGAVRWWTILRTEETTHNEMLWKAKEGASQPPAAKPQPQPQPLQPPEEMQQAPSKSHHPMPPDAGDVTEEIAEEITVEEPTLPALELARPVSVDSAQLTSPTITKRTRRINVQPCLAKKMGY